MNCKNCSVDMLSEGDIDDDILLCHGCYTNENLIKYGYDLDDFLMGAV